MAPTTLDPAAAASFRRGPGGRPTRAEAERRHEALLETASRLFIARGLDGISMEAIAEEAGVAKRFVYARYRDKGELFVATLKRLIEQRAAFLHAYNAGEAPVEPGLLAFAELLESSVVQPEALALYRIVVSELHRFPTLSQLFAAKTAQNIMGGIARVLKIYESRGELRFDDAVMAAELFLTLIVQGARSRALIGIGQTPAERRQRTAAAVRLFVDGYRPRSPASPDAAD
jgi:TetR/AcrR family transcriptional repressor of mexJK operon